MLSRDGRIGWDCIDVVGLLGVFFMGKGESVGNGVDNGDIHCWIVLFGVNTVR